MHRLLLPLFLPLAVLVVAVADHGGQATVPPAAAPGAAVFLVLSGLLAWRARPADPAGPRLDILARLPLLARLVRHPAARPLAQAGFAAVFLGILVVGWFGNQDPGRNLVPLLTWTIWWGGIVLATLFVGKAWCYVCPWDAIAGWLEKPWPRPDAPGIGLRRRWPKRLRHVGWMVALFAGLTWLETGLALETSPRGTALVGLVMLTVTIGFAFLFERRGFCRYVCSVGGVTGLFASFGSVEVRTTDAQVCMACKTKDCYHGNQWGVGCPTDLFPAAFTENTHCINCLECVKTCPYDVMTVRVRPWGTDLFEHRNPRLDEGVLVLLVLAFGLLPALFATPLGAQLEDGEGFGGFVAFGGALVLAAAAVGLLFGGAVRLARRKGDEGFASAFVRLTYGLVPLALFLHLARHLGPLVREGRALVGGGTEPLLSPLALWLVQVLLLAMGNAYALRVTDRHARKLGIGRLPLVLAVLAFGLLSLLSLDA